MSCDLGIASGTRQMDGRRFFCWLLFNCRKLTIINYITLISLIKSITIVLKKILNAAIINVTIISFMCWINIIFVV